MFKQAAKASARHVGRMLRGRVGKAVSCTGILAFAATTASAVDTLYGTDAHRALRIPLALTNTTSGVQRVARVRATCGCVAVDLEEGREVGSGEILEFGAEYRAPFSGDGEVEEQVSVTLAPSGMTVEYPVRVRVRRRLGLEPPEASFGVVEPADVGRELEVRLAGYAALETSVLEVEGGRAFAVRPVEDGRRLRVRFVASSPHAGLYAETWMIRTGDPEVPVLKLPVWARVAEKRNGNDFGTGRERAAGQSVEAGGEGR